MENKFHLTIITPDRELFIGEVVSLNCEGSEGHFGILPNHAPMIATLVPTVTTFQDVSGKQHTAFTSDGVFKVNNNKAVLLCNSAEWPEEIDKKRAEKAKERAESRMKEKDKNLDSTRVQLALLRSLARLKLAQQI
ncbi:F0F1 ATP synthase subunit epsilon [Clostridium sp. UBA4548]|uniref:F0F1 ATP synthase subunit epsilon n=1 Tax=Clostridium sp. UBA4548 TaxID=1946361 RepID=UPI0025BB5282|nr:F0F1 ATP synthase subunit epsilon [Clostridium sp. UBA4548]